MVKISGRNRSSFFGLIRSLQKDANRLGIRAEPIGIKKQNPILDFPRTADFTSFVTRVN